MTGREVAEKMLHDNGIYNVRVTCVPGHLTDHYNPADGTVNLSESVYHSNSVAAAAVAAHECGHAIQHAVAYGPLTLRSTLVSRSIVCLELGAVGAFSRCTAHYRLPPAYWPLVSACLPSPRCSVSSPCPLKSTHRAAPLPWLQRAGITSAYDHPMAVSALRSAAYTYVVAALSSLATLIYYALMLVGASSDE